jgi:hypothetical protein
MFHELETRTIEAIKKLVDNGTVNQFCDLGAVFLYMQMNDCDQEAEDLREAWEDDPEMKDCQLYDYLPSLFDND